MEPKSPMLPIIAEEADDETENPMAQSSIRGSVYSTRKSQKKKKSVAAEPEPKPEVEEFQKKLPTIGAMDDVKFNKLR